MQSCPKVQQQRQVVLMMVMSMTIAAAPADLPNSCFKVIRHPFWGEPVVMSPYHHQVEGWQRPWQSKEVSTLLSRFVICSLDAAEEAHLLSAAFTAAF